MRNLPTLTILMLFLLGHPTLHAEVEDADSDESWGWKAAVVSSLILTLATNPGHADEMSLEYADASDVGSLKAVFKWNHKDNLLTIGDATLRSYFHVGYGKWQSYEDPTQVGANNVLEFIPVFRFERPQESWIDYIETSVGIALFSSTKMNNRNFGSNFQFSDTLGFGSYFGDGNSWDLAFKFQHYSNNSITLPNNGINFYTLSLSHRY